MFFKNKFIIRRRNNNKTYYYSYKKKINSGKWCVAIMDDGVKKKWFWKMADPV